MDEKRIAERLLAYMTIDKKTDASKVIKSIGATAFFCLTQLDDVDVDDMEMALIHARESGIALPASDPAVVRMIKDIHLAVELHGKLMKVLESLGKLR